MAFNYKQDYTSEFRIGETKTEKQQEFAIVTLIMKSIESGKYNSIEAFEAENKDFNTFKNNYKLNMALAHFTDFDKVDKTDGIIDNDEYLRIIDSLKKIIINKKNLDKSNIKETTIDEKNIATFKNGNETMFIQNNDRNKTLETQMKDYQESHLETQTSNVSKNTKNVINGLTQDNSMSLTFESLSEINQKNLTREQAEIYLAAKEYEQSLATPIKINLETGYITNDNDEVINRLVKEDGTVVVKNDNNEKENTNSFQKKLVIEGGYHE